MALFYDYYLLRCIQMRPLRVSQPLDTYTSLQNLAHQPQKLANDRLLRLVTFYKSSDNNLKFSNLWKFICTRRLHWNTFAFRFSLLSSLVLLCGHCTSANLTLCLYLSLQVNHINPCHGHYTDKMAFRSAHGTTLALHGRLAYWAHGLFSVVATVSV